MRSPPSASAGSFGRFATVAVRPCLDDGSPGAVAVRRCLHDGVASGRGDAPVDSPTIEILIVCTGNICRSPMAEGLLRLRLRERGIPAEVSSTGLVAAGRAVPADALAAARRFGVDLDAHRSRVLDRDQLDRADLVLTMEQAHVREVAVLDREHFGRTFTLREIVRRGGEVGPRKDGETVEGWLERVAIGRRVRDVLGVGTGDDVADPYGRSATTYRRAADEIDGLLVRLLDLLWPPSHEVTP